MRTWTNWVAGVVAVVGLAGTTRAADDVDKKAQRSAYDTVSLGVELYNAGNHEGCFRLYQGALMALQPVLSDKLAGTVKDALAMAKGQRAAEGAFTLRKALDAVMGVEAAAMKKPLWDRLGGEPAVKAVVHDFVLAAAPDPKVNFLRDGKFKLDDAGVQKLERQLVELVSAVTGGPLKYTGRDMKTAHAGMKITDAEFDALAGHLVATLKKYNVPKAETDELVGIVGSTRKDIVEGGATAPAKKPLWDRLGGEAAVKAVVGDFVKAAAPDPKVNFFRDGKYKLDAQGVEKLERLLVELVSQTTGGPLKYSGKGMKEVHAGMKITEAEFNALAGHLVATLKKYNVPQAEIDELVGIIATTKTDIVEVK